MRRLLMACTALGLMSTHAHAAYIDSDSFFAAAGNAVSQAIPAQSITITDYFGTYTPEIYTAPVYVGLNGYPYSDPTRMGSRSYLPPAPTDAGQLSGNFGCYSPTFNCLGAHTITYTLPEKVLGIYGLLSGYFGASSSARLSDIPFFEFDYNYVQNPKSNPRYYTGFWGTVFDTPTDTFTVTWMPGVNSRDDGASFRLSDAMVLMPGQAAEIVNVPEPATAALFGIGLLGLVAVRRRAA